MQEENLYTLIKHIELWADEKGIFDNGTPERQADKTLEEAQELKDAILAEDRAEIIDAIGDIFVTIAIQAKMQKVNLEDCVMSAYNVIAKRKGSMINGQFVKQGE